MITSFESLAQGNSNTVTDGGVATGAFRPTGATSHRGLQRIHGPTCGTKGNAKIIPGTTLTETTSNKKLIFKIYNSQTGIERADGKLFFGLNAGLTLMNANKTGNGNKARGTWFIDPNATENVNMAQGYFWCYEHLSGINHATVVSYFPEANASGRKNPAHGFISLVNAIIGNTGVIVVGNNSIRFSTFVPALAKTVQEQKNEKDPV